MEADTFTIVDATSENLNLVELISLGCTRSSHVGLLGDQNTTLAPLLYGLPIRFHEFLRYAGDLDYNVCKFHLLKDSHVEQIDISDDQKIWPPLAKWNAVGRSKIIKQDARFKNLAQVCSSPFSFHLAATKSLFLEHDSISLSSTEFVDRLDDVIGKTKAMRSILELLAGKTSETGRKKTFYRLIDEDGVCWNQQRKVNRDGNVLKFENSCTISIDEAIDSALATFHEMNSLERDPAYNLPNRLRIVMDTAFFIVMDFILSGKLLPNDNLKGKPAFVSYHLAGNDVMRYLVYDAKQSLMYKNQVSKIIHIISKVYCMNVPWILKLVNPVTTVGHSQYSYSHDPRLPSGNEVYPGTTINLSKK